MADKYRTHRKTSADSKNDIESISQELHIPDVINNKALYYLVNFKRNRNCAGTNSMALAAACLHIACRQHEATRSYKEIAAAAHVSVKTVGKICKKVIAALNIRQEEVREGQGLPLAKPHDFFGRYCADIFDVDKERQKVERRARYIASRNEDLGVLSGRSPVSVAAAIILMAARSLNITCDEKVISDSFCISELTIREAFRSLQSRSSEVLPAETVQREPVKRELRPSSFTRLTTNLH